MNEEMSHGMGIKGVVRSIVAPGAAVALLAGCGMDGEIRAPDGDRSGTILVEEGAVLRDLRLTRLAGIEASTAVRLRLDGDVTLADGASEQWMVVGDDGAIDVGELNAGTPYRETIVGVDVDGALAVQMSVVTVPRGWLDVLDGQIVDGDAMIERGSGYAVIDEGRAFEHDPHGVAVGYDEGELAKPLWLCWCPFAWNVGKLTIDTSMKGKVAMWLIPENGSPAFTPVTSNVTYDADGFKIGSQIWKVDGSTCTTLSYSGGGVYYNACVNNLAALDGKKAPYPVPSGTFGNEPPIGVAAKLVL